MNRVAASQERAMGAMDIRAVAISLVRSSEGVISAGESMQLRVQGREERVLRLRFGLDDGGAKRTERRGGEHDSQTRHGLHGDSPTTGPGR